MIRHGRALSSQGPMTTGRSSGAGNAPGTRVRQELWVTQLGPMWGTKAWTIRCSPMLAPWIHVLPGVGKGALHMWRRARGCSHSSGQRAKPAPRQSSMKTLRSIPSPETKRGGRSHPECLTVRAFSRCDDVPWPRGPGPGQCPTVRYGWPRSSSLQAVQAPRR